MSIQRAGFSLLPPPVPLKVSVFFPHLESWIITPDGICFYKCCLSEQKADVTFLQQISKRRHYFPEERVLFRSNLDSGLKRKWYVYSLFGFLQKKGGCLGVKKKRVCSPRPAPTIQSSLLHSTKPKESFRGRVCRHLGGRSGVTDTGRWQLIRKWSKVPSPPKKQQQNQTEKKKRQNHSRRRGLSPQFDTGKNCNKSELVVGVGGRPTVNNRRL